MGDSGGMENRFAYLLQPIRDLTKNWDIDVAAQLEEYLIELETVTISFDGGQTTMNFAEAALLIQGSACVYSKKVEYLYTLVYQMLDLLSCKKKEMQAASLNDDGQDKDVTFLNKKNEDDEFLSLDDIKIHKNTNMKDDILHTSIKLIPRIPLALVPLEDGEKGDIALLSKNGEILANKNDFRLNTCILHPTGALLLDLTDLDNLENAMRQLPTSTPICPTMSENIFENPGAEELQGKDGNIGVVDEGLCDVSMGDDGDGFEIEFENSADNGVKDLGKDKEIARRREKLIKNILAPVPAINPWLTIDPHKKDDKTKPFKKGKIFRIPPSLETEQKKRKRQKPVGTAEVIPISKFISEAFFSHASKFPKNPLKVPTYPELESVFWKEYNTRQSILKKKRVQRIHDVEDVDDEEENDAPIDAADDDDDNDEHHLFDGFGVDVGDIPQLPLDDDTEKEGAVVKTYEDLVRHYVDMYLASAQEYALVTELSKRVAEWEEKIIPKLDEEEHRTPFDIHAYGTIVLNFFKEENHGKWLPFRKIVDGKSCYEACRLFLATLQLANNCNVELRVKNSGESGVDSMEIKLLTQKRHFEELAEYRAPSLFS